LSVISHGVFLKKLHLLKKDRKKQVFDAFCEIQRPFNSKKCNIVFEDGQKSEFQSFFDKYYF